MDISGQGGLHQTGGVVFSVASTLSGRVYLRSLTYGDYTGSGWKEADYGISELADKYAYAAVSAANGASRGTLAVTRVGDVSGLFHMPYYNNGEYYFETGGSGIYSLSELWSYSVDYIKYTGDYSDAVLTGADAEAEKSTREAIYEAYTTLPDATKSAMLDIARENNLSSDIADIINEVAAFVKNSAVYDLNISPMPDGEDCAVYFLTQSHRGYCIHFATAAAVMYRALGIPARVVSGFMFTTVADELVSVTDKDAHAWTEVYMDGVGWIPVEATGSTAAGATDSGEAERTASQTPVGIASMDDDSESASVLSILLKILITVLVVCAVIFRRIPAKAVRSRVFSGGKTNRAMVQIWKYARRVGRFGLPIPEVIQAAADRACFSRDGIDREELASAADAAEEYAERTYAGLSPLRRFVFKYLRGLI